ncbi:MAG TPA: SAM-dependent methyltransferase [Lysobacter sp.]|nr:SAM-dependent methyltransferase [Lysobacter sp.]
MDTPNPIRNVSDTALWVAIYRAMETERSDALFRDPYARRLGGARGQAIVDALPDGQQTSWPLVVRTCVMDDIVRRCVQMGAKTVLNLAAGLDARPYRLDLPAGLRWLHVDMPEMVEYFRKGMEGETPKCRLEFLSADLREADVRRAVFAKAAEEGPVLAITEGLLIYLEAEEVAPLARDLHDIANARWWLADLATPRLLKLLEKRWSPTLKGGNAPFRFGPAESTAWFAPYGWRELEFHSTWTDAMRLNRKPRGAALWNFLLKISPKKQREEQLRMSGIALMERT